MKHQHICFALLTCCLFTFGCLPLQQEKPPFTEQQNMLEYSESRYLTAMDYMEQGRYELASQQFSIAAESAPNRELRELAQTGQEKADAIIINQR